MPEWMRNVWGLLCACGGAVVWGISLTVLQPPTEPVADLASNNTYWARDARLMAILVMLGGLIIATRGDRFLSAVGAFGAVGWLGLDLVLDRTDVAGPVATIAVPVAACAAMVGAHWASRVRRLVSSRRVLIVAGAVAAALVPVAGGLTSETDTEVGLTPTALALGCLFIAVALGCAMSAAPTLTVALRRTAVGLVIAAVVGLVAMRVVPLDYELPIAVLLGPVLLTGVAVLTGDWPSSTRGWLRYAVLAVVLLTVYPVLLFVTLIVTVFVVQVGAPLTALAGNPAVNSADEDGLLTLCGLLPGLVLGAAFLLLESRTASPAPATPTPADAR